MEKVCPKGHRFDKTSDCPTCPVCEAAKNEDFFVKLSAPARRALQNLDIDTVEKLSMHTEKEILAEHGMGKASLPALYSILKENNLSFKK